MSAHAQAATRFAAHFGEASRFVARAPGRVNLIGEHTDYNGGFVLPMAIDREICIAFRPRADRRVVLHSLDYDETAQFDLAALQYESHHWIEYVKGAAAMLDGKGVKLEGWEGVVSGDVPRGAGLSSSAALELAALRVFTHLAGAPWDAPAAALLGQRVENEWIGVNSGIMDQMVVACATRGHALLLDCRTLIYRHVAVPLDVAVIILDTSTRRGLVDSAYNERRAQCERAAGMFDVPALRDLTPAALEAGKPRLDELTYRRAHHVVTENERTLRAADALSAGQAGALGRLMNESHASLRDDFQVTNHALDAIVAIAQQQDACYGARMTGAGFGGCAVAITSHEAADRFIENVTRGYQSITGLEPRAYVCRAAAGASLETETSMESVPS
jgi:galactokinase